VSTPNKRAYTDVPQYKNPFHMHELYFDEFKGLLERHFGHVEFLGQRVYCNSNIWPIRPGDNVRLLEHVIERQAQEFVLVDGAVSFQGKGFQLHYNMPADKVTREEKPLLFACGCGMLIDRLFLDAGRWDEGAFASYEDVELGGFSGVLGGNAPEGVSGFPLDPQKDSRMLDGAVGEEQARPHRGAARARASPRAIQVR
jgi:hypothetical protein